VVIENFAGGVRSDAVWAVVSTRVLDAVSQLEALGYTVTLTPLADTA
jgi:hypothetical protein